MAIPRSVNIFTVLLVACVAFQVANAIFPFLWGGGNRVPGDIQSGPSCERQCRQRCYEYGIPGPYPGQVAFGCHSTCDCSYYLGFGK